MRVLEQTLSLWNGLLDTIFPPQCLICGMLDRQEICPDCLAGFLPVTGKICSRCGRLSAGAICRDCAEMELLGGWEIETIRSGAIYEGTLVTAIQRLKYNGIEGLGEPLGNYLYQRLETGALFPAEVIAEISAIVPIPLHTMRLRKRGYNQSALLARSIAQGLNVPMRCDVVNRIEATRQQVNLSASERRANMLHRNVFEARSGKGLTGRGILLVDDVLTTGATLNACARAVRSIYEGKIYALTLAVSD